MPTDYYDDDEWDDGYTHPRSVRTTLWNAPVSTPDPAQRLIIEEAME